MMVEYELLLARVKALLGVALAIRRIQIDTGIAALPEVVEAALRDVWPALTAFLRLDKRFHAKGWTLRVSDGSDVGALAAVRSAVDGALATALSALNVIGAAMLTEVRGVVVDTAETAATVLRIVQQVDAKVDRVLNNSTDGAPPSSALMDEPTYARAIVQSFGSLGQLADAMGPSGSAYRPLGLSDVFVAQHVLRCEGCGSAVGLVPSPLVRFHCP